MISRRRFLQLTSLGTLATGLYSWQVEPYWVEFVRRPLPVPRLPSRLHGRTLVHFSDIHVGPRVDDDYLIGVFQRAAALTPDIVVVTGDFITHHPDIYDHAARVYRHFPKGRLATLGIRGITITDRRGRTRISRSGLSKSWKRGASRCSGMVSPDIEGLQVVGLGESRRAFKPTPILTTVEPAKASLVLSHNPDTVDLPGWESFKGWILSGHTHGGQCRPPLSFRRNCLCRTGGTLRENFS